MKKIAIIGASGHGKVIADIALLNGYDKIVFLDDKEGLESIGEYPVVGKSTETGTLAANGYDFIVGIGNASIRMKIQNALEQSGCRVVKLIHPSAKIAYDVEIGKGTVIMAHSVINAGAVIGKGCIINTCASVDNDNSIGDFVHISVGAHTGSYVTVENGCWIGIGAVVNDNISICGNCMIGAGAVVVNDLKELGTYIGVPVTKK